MKMIMTTTMLMMLAMMMMAMMMMAMKIVLRNCREFSIYPLVRWSAENSRSVTFVQAAASFFLSQPVFLASVSDCGPSATRRVSYRTP